MASVVGKLWREMGKRVTGSAVCLTLLMGLWGCSQQSSPLSMADNALKGALTQSANIEEVSPPGVIAQLRRSLFSQDPQVKIVGLKSGAIIEQTSANIRFDVDNFSIFKDSELALGPHLTVLLDDQPYIEVYDAKQNITLSDLKAGTHKLQVFASTPWHESLKTPGAFEELSFSVFSPTQADQGTAIQPHLIYSQPEGTYGAEPILLDYILTSPSAQTKQTSKVRVTVNGNSFISEEQPPIYLKGFKSGINWVKVEVLDADGKAIANPASETIQLVTLKPGGNDSLSKLTRGELTPKDAEQILSLEASQRRAAERLEALSAPKPTPAPKTIELKEEKNAEEKPEVSLPEKLIPALPTQTVVTPPAEPKLSRPIPKPIDTQVDTQAESRAIAPKPSSSTTNKSFVKSVPESDAPLQSFLKRFRQPDLVKPAAPSAPSSPLPTQIIPPASAEVPHPSPTPNKPMSPLPSTPAKAAVITQPVKPMDKISALSDLEKTTTRKLGTLKVSPEIVWKKFLPFKVGETVNPSSIKDTPNPTSKTSEPKSEKLETSPR
jgi:hypothetical protein